MPPEGLPAARAGAEAEVRGRVPDVAALADALDGVDYLADAGLATALFLAVRLPQPLLLEGEPGVGKTEAAKALARVLDTPLYRLQCFEGIDAAEALYEWNHPRQLLASGSPRPAVRRWPRTTCSAPTTCCAGRCCRPSSTPARDPPSSSWTRSIAPTRSSRRSPSRCWPRRRSPSPSWAPSGPGTHRSSSSPPTARATCTMR